MATHLFVWSKVQSKHPVKVFPVYLCSGLQKRNCGVPCSNRCQCPSISSKLSWDLTVSLRDCMMQRCISGDIGGIQRALVLDQEVDHGHRTNSRSPVEGVLAPFVPNAG